MKVCLVVEEFSLASFSGDQRCLGILTTPRNLGVKALRFGTYLAVSVGLKLVKARLFAARSYFKVYWTI